LSVRPDQQRFVADYAPIAAIVLAKSFVRPEGFVWAPYGIYVGAALAGMLALAYEPGSADKYWIYHFFIDQAHQGRAYGRRALQALIELLRDTYPACRQIQLTVHPANLPAQRLYAGAGFQPTGEIIDGEPVYRLELG
jgi:diamine N-acetyltransferase